jgi:hypothetical protein
MTTFPGISWKLVGLSQAQYNTKVADYQESMFGESLSLPSHYDFDSGCIRAADVTSPGNGPFVRKPSFHSRDTQKAPYLGHFRYSCLSLLNLCQNDEPLAEVIEDNVSNCVTLLPFDVLHLIIFTSDCTKYLRM